MTRPILLPLCVAFLAAFALPAQDKKDSPQPSWTKDIKPFLAKYCYECHNGPKGKGKLDVSTYASFQKGGESFPGFVPGNVKDSFAVELVEGGTPRMPPKEKKQPTAEERKLLRAWVLAGAKDDSTATKKVELPRIEPKANVPPPVTALAFRPDGTWLAVADRDQVVPLDPMTGQFAPRPKLTGLPITALAYSKDGRLAVARGLPGERGGLEIFSRDDADPVRLEGHGDIILAVAWSPNGQLLASAGYDRLIKIWEKESGKELYTLKDHSDSVYGLAFSPDGTLLASVSADRAVKVWDVATGRRLYTLADSTDWVYAVAWSGQHLAAAGVDKSIRVWEASAKEGKLVHSVFAHEGPVVKLVYSADGKTLYSIGEDRVLKSWDAARMVEKKVYDKQPEVVLALAVAPDGKRIALGRYDGVLVLLDEASGKVLAQATPAAAPPKKEEKKAEPQDRFPGAKEAEPNDSPLTGQKIDLSASVAGSLDRAGDVDWYRFEAKEKQEIGVQVVAADAAKLEPVLQLVDPAGKIVAEGGAVLGHRSAAAGTHSLGVRDREYRGGGLAYKLHAGDVPVVTAVFPLGLRRGTEAEVRVEGVYLGAKLVRVKAAADAAIGSRVALTVPTPHGKALGIDSVVVGEFPEAALDAVLTAPATGNGRITVPGQADVWKFDAKKGQRLIIEVQARRIGSPLDSVIDILHPSGQPLPQAVLRGQAKTYTNFRDHDNVSPGIRIEAWNELAINDYILIGDQLLRIRALPKNPDDDCQFFAESGQRLGFLGTTPTHLSQGTPMYKMAIHPPGSTFPPNGLPLVTLYHRNDDGGPGLGKDSRLFFDPPADGTYGVRVGDVRGQAGAHYGYRLTVRPPRPDFKVSFTPTAPAVWKGGALPITVSTDRSDGFDGAIELKLENLPPGFSAPATTIPAGESSTVFALAADKDAPFVDKAPPLKLVAKAKVGGQELIRETSGGVAKTAEPGEIVALTDQSEITVRPGQSVKLTVQIERRLGFKGRVPVEVRGLPHGVRVLDIGLNGILITEAETRRTMEIYCESWVEPTEHPFVVFAKREGKNTEHGAKSVLLRVVK